MRQVGTLYQGKGITLLSRTGEAVPQFVDSPRLYDPQRYLPDTGLVAAVNVALALGQPLLITGEPGTGKTQLAHSIAHELGLTLFIFNTKTTSTYQDLFYKYDALRHYHAVLMKRDEVTLENYITYGPIGEAIRYAMDRRSPHCPTDLVGTTPQRSIVLIDEIDKAPRDLPNDVLNEIDRMSFEVTECRLRFEADTEYRPILIFTSNLEKDLPGAFRRRCVFYHIMFPEDERLEAIVSQRLGLSDTTLIRNAIKHFRAIRALDLEKLPATAELIAWIEVLRSLDLEFKEDDALSSEQSAALLASFSVLAKTAADFQRVKEHFATTHGHE